MTKDSRIESEKSDSLRNWLIGTSIGLALSVSGAGAGYYLLTTPPAELSAEAVACWQEHKAEFTREFAQKWQVENEKVQTLEKKSTSLKRRGV